MSVLVTGGAGYIGSHMVLALLDRGEEVIVLDDLSTGFEWAVPAGAIFYRGSVRDRALVRRILGEHETHAVVHFAASLVVDESVREPAAYYANNTAGLCDLLDEVVRARVAHFIFSSTAAVYGSAGTEPIGEEAPKHPVSPYGRSKLMCETILQDVARAAGMGFAILRYFNVAGADPQRRSGQSAQGATHLVKVALEAALGKREAMQIFGTDYPTPDGTAVRDYVHVSDLAEAHLRALDCLRSGTGELVANVGYGRGFSVREILSAVAAVTALPVPASEGPRRKGDAVSIIADASRLRETTGWAPAHDDLAAIIGHALEWERHLSRRNAPSS